MRRRSTDVVESMAEEVEVEEESGSGKRKVLVLLLDRREESAVVAGLTVDWRKVVDLCVNCLILVASLHCVASGKLRVVDPWVPNRRPLELGVRRLATERSESGDALAVQAAADPVEAVLRAGETPSPELVAESGPREGLTPAIVWTGTNIFTVR